MRYRSRRILVVDPDNGVAQALSSILVNEDYEVEITEGLTQASERLHDVEFDCIIIDIELPEMEGFKAVPILKAIDPKVQIIMTAAENTVELEAKVRKQDIFYYYIKSFDRKELIEAVRDVFKKIGKVKETRKMSTLPNILVVDDDPNFVVVIKPVLESKGYKVDAAYNRQEAMEKLESFKPDLIVLDIMMEKLTDGFNICYKLKHDPEMKNIPVLAVSAITEKTGFKFSPATDGEYFEADDYVAKPIKLSDLLERIEKLLKG
jgi:CheY-like chemotaxis protein